MIAGDTKSPLDFEIKGADFFDIVAQEVTGFQLARLCPTQHYARKNIAYLEAIRSGAKLIIETDDKRKFAIPELLKQDSELTEGARVFTTDGLRIEFSTGWGLIRPSNTTPTLTLRFAAQDEQTIALIQQKMKQALTRHAPEIQTPF